MLGEHCAAGKRAKKNQNMEQDQKSTILGMFSILTRLFHTWMLKLVAFTGPSLGLNSHLWFFFFFFYSKMFLTWIHWASKQTKPSPPGPLTQTEDPGLVGVVVCPGFFSDASPRISQATGSLFWWVHSILSRSLVPMCPAPGFSLWRADVRVARPRPLCT